MTGMAVWILTIAVVIIALPTALALAVYGLWGFAILSLWFIDKVTP